jgi:hypothetical protein
MYQETLSKNNPAEEEIESLCKLLTTIGQQLDTQKASKHGRLLRRDEKAFKQSQDCFTYAIDVNCKSSKDTCPTSLIFIIVRVF